MSCSLMSQLQESQHQKVSIPKCADMFKMECVCKNAVCETGDKTLWNLWHVSWTHSHILFMLIINHKVYSHHKHRRGRVQKIHGSSLPQVSVFLKREVCYSGFLTCAMPGNELGKVSSQKLKVWRDHCSRNYERDSSPSFSDRESSVLVLWLP